MDQLKLAEIIESLRRCIKRIEDKKPESVDFLIQNLDLQDSKGDSTRNLFLKFNRRATHVGTGISIDIINRHKTIQATFCTDIDQGITTCPFQRLINGMRHNGMRHERGSKLK